MNNYEYYENEYIQIKEIYSSLSHTTLCILAGEYGTGKST